MVVNELLNLGLTEKEAEVYLATLQLGQATVQNIAKKAEINRTTVYTHIKNLIARGLISASEKFGKQYFVAEKPQKLKLFFEQQEKEVQKRKETIEKIMPELESLYNLAIDQPSVKLYKHSDLAMARNEILSGKNGDLYTIVNTDLFNEEGIDHDYVQKLMDSCDSSKIIYVNKIKKTWNYEEFKRVPSYFEKTQFKYLPAQLYNFPCEIFFTDHVLIVNDKKNILIIKDKLMVQIMKTIFTVLWGLAEDFNISTVN
jgi:HTH-type transcriptional regulator, sugar sensing transcriptional regulator